MIPSHLPLTRGVPVPSTELPLSNIQPWTHFVIWYTSDLQPAGQGTMREWRIGRWGLVALLIAALLLALATNLSLGEVRPPFPDSTVAGPIRRRPSTRSLDRPPFRAHLLASQAWQLRPIESLRAIIQSAPASRPAPTTEAAAAVGPAAAGLLSEDPEDSAAPPEGDHSVIESAIDGLTGLAAWATGDDGAKPPEEAAPEAPGALPVNGSAVEAGGELEPTLLGRLLGWAAPVWSQPEGSDQDGVEGAGNNTLSPASEGRRKRRRGRSRKALKSHRGARDGAIATVAAPSVDGRSAYYSIGLVKPFAGDIHDPDVLKAAAKARSYKVQERLAGSGGCV